MVPMEIPLALDQFLSSLPCERSSCWSASPDVVLEAAEEQDMFGSPEEHGCVLLLGYAVNTSWFQGTHLASSRGRTEPAYAICLSHISSSVSRSWASNPHVETKELVRWLQALLDTRTGYSRLVAALPVAIRTATEPRAKILVHRLQQ